jgi:flagellar basal-body rod protein FlgF
MDPLMISAASGMKARMETLDILANNVANTGTAGFKSDREFYNLYTSQEAVDAENGLRPGPSTLPVLERHWTDFRQGTFVNTGNSLDLAIAGKGFFVAESSNGPLYTRNGNFRLGTDGQIVTNDGKIVRALRPDGKPVKLDPAVPVDIDPKGEIRQSGQVAGKLVLVEFGDESRLAKLGNTYFKFDGPNPQLAAAAEVHQGSLESANVPVAEAAVRLVSVMRQFEMLQRAISLGGDMNRRAVEEVAKVS